jgi:methyltransferase-like protein
MVVTNLRHERVQLGALDHELLRHLDGTRDRKSLAPLLAGALASGQLTIRNESGPLPETEQTADLISEILECSLASLGRQALLLPQTG